MKKKTFKKTKTNPSPILMQAGLAVPARLGGKGNKAITEWKRWHKRELDGHAKRRPSEAAALKRMYGSDVAFLEAVRKVVSDAGEGGIKGDDLIPEVTKLLKSTLSPRDYKPGSGPSSIRHFARVLEFFGTIDYSEGRWRSVGLKSNPRKKTKKKTTLKAKAKKAGRKVKEETKYRGKIKWSKSGGDYSSQEFPLGGKWKFQLTATKVKAGKYILIAGARNGQDYLDPDYAYFKTGGYPIKKVKEDAQKMLDAGVYTRVSKPKKGHAPYKFLPDDFFDEKDRFSESSPVENPAKKTKKKTTLKAKAKKAGRKVKKVAKTDMGRAGIGGGIGALALGPIGAVIGAGYAISSSKKKKSKKNPGDVDRYTSTDLLIPFKMYLDNKDLTKKRRAYWKKWGVLDRIDELTARGIPVNISSKEIGVIDGTREDEYPGTYNVRISKGGGGYYKKGDTAFAVRADKIVANNMEYFHGIPDPAFIRGSRIALGDKYRPHGGNVELPNARHNPPKRAKNNPGPTCKLSTTMGNLLLDYHKAGEAVEHVAASSLRGERVELRYVKAARADLKKIQKIQPKESEEEQIEDLVDALSRVIAKCEGKSTPRSKPAPKSNPARAFSLETEVNRSRQKKAKGAAGKHSRASSAASDAARQSLRKRMAALNPGSYRSQVVDFSDAKLDAEHKAASSLITRAKRHPDTSQKMVDDLVKVRGYITDEKKARKKRKSKRGGSSGHVVPVSNPTSVGRSRGKFTKLFTPDKEEIRLLRKYKMMDKLEDVSASQIERIVTRLKRQEKEELKVEYPTVMDLATTYARARSRYQILVTSPGTSPGDIARAKKKFDEAEDALALYAEIRNMDQKLLKEIVWHTKKKEREAKAAKPNPKPSRTKLIKAKLAKERRAKKSKLAGTGAGIGSILMGPPLPGSNPDHGPVKHIVAGGLQYRGSRGHDDHWFLPKFADQEKFLKAALFYVANKGKVPLIKLERKFSRSLVWWALDEKYLKFDGKPAMSMEEIGKHFKIYPTNASLVITPKGKKIADRARAELSSLSREEQEWEEHVLRPQSNPLSHVTEKTPEKKFRAAISRNIATEMKAGRPQKQAIAIALNQARTDAPKKALKIYGPKPNPSSIDPETGHVLPASNPLKKTSKKKATKKTTAKKAKGNPTSSKSSSKIDGKLYAATLKKFIKNLNGYGVGATILSSYKDKAELSPRARRTPNDIVISADADLYLGIEVKNSRDFDDFILASAMDKTPEFEALWEVERSKEKDNKFRFIVRPRKKPKLDSPKVKSKKPSGEALLGEYMHRGLRAGGPRKETEEFVKGRQKDIFGSMRKYAQSEVYDNPALTPKEKGLLLNVSIDPTYPQKAAHKKFGKATADRLLSVGLMDSARARGSSGAVYMPTSEGLKAVRAFAPLSTPEEEEWDDVVDQAQIAADRNLNPEPTLVTKGKIGIAKFKGQGKGLTDKDLAQLEEIKGNLEIHYELASLYTGAKAKNERARIKDSLRDVNELIRGARRKANPKGNPTSSWRIMGPFASMRKHAQSSGMFWIEASRDSVKGLLKDWLKPFTSEEMDSSVEMRAGDIILMEFSSKGAIGMTVYLSLNRLDWGKRNSYVWRVLSDGYEGIKVMSEKKSRTRDGALRSLMSLRDGLPSAYTKGEGKYRLDDISSIAQELLRSSNPRKKSKEKTKAAKKNPKNNPSELEGPFRFASGRVVYYDPGEGKYYDRDTDLYLSESEVESMQSGSKGRAKGNPKKKVAKKAGKPISDKEFWKQTESLNWDRKPISDKEFWKQIESLNWPKLRKVHLSKGLSWDEQREALLKKKPMSYWKEIAAIAQCKANVVVARLDLGVNDFAWDFSSDIVGHGKRTYDRMISDDAWAEKQLDSKKYGAENFFYIFPRDEREEKDSVSKDELSAAYKLLKKEDPLVTQDEFDMTEAYARMKESGGTLGEHMDVVQAERASKPRANPKKKKAKRNPASRSLTPHEGVNKWKAFASPSWYLEDYSHKSDGKLDTLRFGPTRQNDSGYYVDVFLNDGYADVMDINAHLRVKKIERLEAENDRSFIARVLVKTIFLPPAKPYPWNIPNKANPKPPAKKKAKGKPISDKEFWKQIESLNWPKLRKICLSKGLSWDEQREALLKKKPMSYWEEIAAIAQGKADVIVARLDLGVNDFAWDFSSDIVGHGKRTYDRIISDEAWAKKQLDSKKYGAENFFYIFPRDEREDSDSVSKEELAASYKLLKKEDPLVTQDESDMTEAYSRMKESGGTLEEHMGVVQAERTSNPRAHEPGGIYYVVRTDLIKPITERRWDWLTDQGWSREDSSKADSSIRYKTLIPKSEWNLPGPIPVVRHAQGSQGIETSFADPKKAMEAARLYEKNDLKWAKRAAEGKGRLETTPRIVKLTKVDLNKPPGKRRRAVYLYVGYPKHQALYEPWDAKIRPRYFKFPKATTANPKAKANPGSSSRITEGQVRKILGKIDIGVRDIVDHPDIAKELGVKKVMEIRITDGKDPTSRGRITDVVVWQRKGGTFGYIYSDPSRLFGLNRDYVTSWSRGYASLKDVLHFAIAKSEMGKFQGEMAWRKANPGVKNSWLKSDGKNDVRIHKAINKIGRMSKSEADLYIPKIEKSLQKNIKKMQSGDIHDSMSQEWDDAMFDILFDEFRRSLAKRRAGKKLSRHEAEDIKGIPDAIPAKSNPQDNPASLRKRRIAMLVMNIKGKHSHRVNVGSAYLLWMLNDARKPTSWAELEKQYHKIRKIDGSDMGWYSVVDASRFVDVFLDKATDSHGVEIVSLNWKGKAFVNDAYGAVAAVSGEKTKSPKKSSKEALLGEYMQRGLRGGGPRKETEEFVKGRQKDIFASMRKHAQSQVYDNPTGRKSTSNIKDGMAKVRTGTNFNGWKLVKKDPVTLKTKPHFSDEEHLLVVVDPISGEGDARIYAIYDERGNFSGERAIRYKSEWPKELNSATKWANSTLGLSSSVRANPKAKKGPKKNNPSELEGPFRFASGRVVYYDPGEGKYYDKDADLYLSESEVESMQGGPKGRAKAKAKKAAKKNPSRQSGGFYIVDTRVGKVAAGPYSVREADMTLEESAGYDHATHQVMDERHLADLAFDAKGNPTAKKKAKAKANPRAGSDLLRYSNRVRYEGSGPGPEGLGLKRNDLVEMEISRGWGTGSFKRFGRVTDVISVPNSSFGKTITGYEINQWDHGGYEGYRNPLSLVWERVGPWYGSGPGSYREIKWRLKVRDDLYKNRIKDIFEVNEVKRVGRVESDASGAPIQRTIALDPRHREYIVFTETYAKAKTQKKNPLGRGSGNSGPSTDLKDYRISAHNMSDRVISATFNKLKSSRDPVDRQKANILGAEMGVRDSVSRHRNPGKVVAGWTLEHPEEGEWGKNINGVSYGASWEVDNTSDNELVYHIGYWDNYPSLETHVRGGLTVRTKTPLTPGRILLAAQKKIKGTKTKFPSSADVARNIRVKFGSLSPSPSKKWWSLGDLYQFNFWPRIPKNTFLAAIKPLFDDGEFELNSDKKRFRRTTRMKYQFNPGSKVSKEKAPSDSVRKKNGSRAPLDWEKAQGESRVRKDRDTRIQERLYGTFDGDSVVDLAKWTHSKRAKRIGIRTSKDRLKVINRESRQGNLRATPADFRKAKSIALKEVLEKEVIKSRSSFYGDLEGRIEHERIYINDRISKARLETEKETLRRSFKVRKKALLVTQRELLRAGDLGIKKNDLKRKVTADSGATTDSPATWSINVLKNLGLARYSDKKWRAVSPNPSAKKVAKKATRKNKPGWKILTDRCDKLWDDYDKKPTKKNLNLVLDHLAKMKASTKYETSKKVRDKRASCLRKANKEAKRLGMKL